jgi:hypothetical protein
MSGALSARSQRCWPTLLSGRLGPALLRRRIPLLLALAVLGILVLLPATPPKLSPVADQTPQISVQISTLTPLSPGPKDTLRITGRVVSTGGADLSEVQISLHIGRAVSSRTELQGLYAQPVPQLLFGQQQTLGDGKLSTGHSLPFTISTPISELGLPYAGVYPLQVTAIGELDGASSQIDLAAASTFLPYILSDAQSPATPLAWLIPLTGEPSLLSDGSLTSDSSKEGSPDLAAVASGGRLRGLLDALGSADVATATIDPATIPALSTAAAGRYTVSGSTRSRPASADAKRWLSDLSAADQVSLVAVPYADPDAVALLRDDQRGLLDSTVQRGTEILKSSLGDAASRLSSAVAVPPGGAVDTATASYYRSATQAKGLVLDASAVPATGDNPSASASAPNVSSRLLLRDSVLTGLTTSGPGSSPRLAEQEVIAELAEAHLEDRFAGSSAQGSADEAARPLLIAPESGATLSASWLKTLLKDTSSLPWLKQIPVTDLLTSVAEPRAALSYPAAAKAKEIPAATATAAAEVITSAGRIFPSKTPADITTQPRSPQSILTPIRDTAMSAVSSRWRDQPQRADLFQANAASAVAALRSGVRVVASPQVTLTSRSGKVPVTLENDLQSAVDVSLVLTSLDKARVSSDTVVRRTVLAGQKVQVEVEVKAASAGTFPVRLALYSQDGLPMGNPAQILVRSTKYGVVATIFTIAALSLLGLAVLVRAARRILGRHRPAETA